jgi:1-acyl-sn-glycerol-3-phosphate acyltransferase
MKWTREILGRIFAFWALVVFVTSMLLFFIPIWITGLWAEPRRTIYVYHVYHVWMKFFFVLSGVTRKIRGRKKFMKGEVYVVVCNHNSFMDVPLSSPGIAGPNKTIAKKEMASIPLFGMVYKRGSVLVDRKSEESRRNSYVKMKEVLSMGLHMCIYPEGTRNKTGMPLQRFHEGAFKLAVETGNRIMPAVISGTKEVLPLKPFFFWPGTVTMDFLDPISVNGKTSKELKEEVHGIMEKFILEQRTK